MCNLLYCICISPILICKGPHFNRCRRWARTIRLRVSLPADSVEYFPSVSSAMPLRGYGGITMLRAAAWYCLPISAGGSQGSTVKLMLASELNRFAMWHFSTFSLCLWGSKCQMTQHNPSYFAALVSSLYSAGIQLLCR